MTKLDMKIGNLTINNNNKKQNKKEKNKVIIFLFWNDALSVYITNKANYTELNKSICIIRRQLAKINLKWKNL